MISLPLKPKVIKEEGDKAIFEIEALYPGYGVTIGNSLRRVLFSSLPGAAVTQMNIKAVQHEFSTITGVLEDVVTIMLNLKQLRFKMYTKEPQRAKLSVNGEKKVKGSDFKFSSQVELVNKDCHIATLTDKKSTLEIEIQIERGLGYIPKKLRKTEKLEIGTILVDAIFTPVKRVAFRVENIRVGDRTDFDKLFLEVETDGTITPQEALFGASEILSQHFNLIAEPFKPKTEEKPVKKGKKIESDLTKIEIEDLKISSRTINILLKNNIKTVGGILRKSKGTLLELEGMGEKGIKEIEKSFKKIGLEIK